MKIAALPIKCINSVWQSSDGKLFVGTENAREECRRHEIDLVLNHVLPRLSEIGYVEKDATEYGELFARRHHGTLISATPRSTAEWHDLVNYITLKYEVPDLIREEGKLTPEFPYAAHVLVYRGIKRAHARMIPDSFLKCILQKEEEMRLTPVDAAEQPAPDHKKRRLRGKKFLYDGEMRTIPQISEITGLRAKTIYARFYAGWDPERAFTTPIMSQVEIGRAGGLAHRKRSAATPFPA